MLLRSFLYFIVLGFSFLAMTQPAFAMPSERALASMSFPNIEATSSRTEVLSLYPAYLQFVVDVGKTVDNANAGRLMKIYQILLQRSPNSAALFLKGLRFEMVEKAELMGRNPTQLSTQTPEIRRWVAKYMKEWVREADEHLFRAVTIRKAELAKAE